ncbi:MAG: hypothetical protein LBS01_11195 [Prevotellaceae bacterium]|nr:hypothetical protein [Prevotellaceae bacterium]
MLITITVSWLQISVNFWKYATSWAKKLAVRKNELLLANPLFQSSQPSENAH